MVDMVRRITPRHKTITLKATALLRTIVTVMTEVARARPAKGNLESTIPQDRPRRRGDAPHVNRPSISLVSHVSSQFRSSRYVTFAMFDRVVDDLPLLHSSQTFPGMSPSHLLSPMLTSQGRRRLWAIPGRTCIRTKTSPPTSLNVPNVARQNSSGIGPRSRSTDLTASVSFHSHISPTSMGRKCPLDMRRSTKTEISCRTERTSSVRLTKSSKAVKAPREAGERNSRLPKGANATDRPKPLPANHCTNHHHTRTTADATTTTKNRGAGIEDGPEIGRPKGIQGILRQDPANRTAIRDHRRSIPTTNRITSHLPRPLRTRHHHNSPHQ